MTTPSKPSAALSSDNAVVLPVEPGQFREFVSGLLGRPQTIEREVAGPFEVRRDDVENLHHLISQRLESQNDSFFVSFRARIIYDDNSSVSLNSLHEFLTYNEVKPIISRGLYLSWVFLISFPGRAAPEKQEIEVGFAAAANPFAFERALPAGRAVVRETPGAMSLRVHHTDRTWGADIDALVAGFLKTLVKHQPPIREFVGKYSGWIAVASTLCLFVALLFIVTAVRSHHRNIFRMKALNILSLSGTDAAETKINFLIDALSTGDWAPDNVLLGIVLLIIVVTPIIGGIWIGDLAERKLPSFVLLSSAAHSDRELALRKVERNWVKFCFSIVGALVLAVVGNFLSAVLARIWPW